MYHSLFVAGTFEGLHAGHRFLLTRAFEEGERVTIGLTTDAFVRHHKLGKLAQLVQFNERKKALQRWLTARKLDARATIIPIDDPYEPAASMEDLDALIVTQENRKTGEHINIIRQGATLPRLSLLEVAMVPAEDGKRISSTRLRNGEIDHNGRLIMPESLRSTLGTPLERVLRGQAVTQSIQRNRDKVITTVGDVATKTLLDAGIVPFLSIVDGKVGRKPYPIVVSQLRKTTSCEAKSGPGYISREAVNAIQGCFSHNASRIPSTSLRTGTHNALLIDGEEDLLVLPVIIHAPNGAIVYYGQPGEGLVEVVVTKAKKQQALALLAKFLS